MQKLVRTVWLTLSAGCRQCVGNVSVSCRPTGYQQPNMGAIVHRICKAFLTLRLTQHYKGRGRAK